MIKGMHGLFYSKNARATRAFFRDKLGFKKSVDAGEGWLIFGVPKAEFGVHPGEDGHHEISFWCDDIEKTVGALKKKGVRFTGPVEDRGFGLVTSFKIPGGGQAILYEPRHAQP